MISLPVSRDGSRTRDTPARSAGPNRQSEVAASFRGRMLLGLCAVALVTVALALSLPRLHYPFWQDELWVVRSTETHAGRNITPPLFYALVRLADELPWSPETNLRLPSLFAALLAVSLPLLCAPFCRPHLSWPAAILWAFFLATSSPIIFYATCVKAYTTEVAAATATACSFLAVLAAGGSARAWFLFALFGAASVATLYPPVFLYAGTFTAAAIRTVSRSHGRWHVNRAQLLRGSLAHGAVFLCFALAYITYLRSDSPQDALNRRTDLVDYWTPFFWDGSAAFVLRQARHYIGQLLNLAPLGAPLLAAAWMLWMLAPGGPPRRERLALTTLAAAPLGVLLVASARHLYPFGAIRLMLFLAPAVFLVVARSFADLLRAPRPLPALALCLAVPLLSAVGWNGVAREPYTTGFMRYCDRRPLHAFLRAAHRGQEPVLVESVFDAEFRHYCPNLAPYITTNADAARSAPLFWLVHREGSGVIAAALPDGPAAAARSASLRVGGVSVDGYVREPSSTRGDP